jgi:predicted metalloprotease with PDZ domain
MIIYYLFRIILICAILITGIARGQNVYRYSVDLTKISDDKLHVELLTPRVEGSSVIFALPKIIPGTYVVADYGKFVSDVKAFDKNGKTLPVSKQGDNQWKITNASRLNKVTYSVEDIFDTEIKHIVYPMAATDFEEGKAFVIHTPGIFGFIDGMNKLPFEVSIPNLQLSLALQLLSRKALRLQQMFL